MMPRETFEERLGDIIADCRTALKDCRAVDSISWTPRERALLRRECVRIDAAITDLEMESGVAVAYYRGAEEKMHLPSPVYIDEAQTLRNYDFASRESQGEGC